VRLESLWYDFRYAARQIRQSPAYASAVALTLMLAIGANTAIFSVVRAVLLRPLPYPDAARLVTIWRGDGPGPSWYTFSHPGFQYFREHLAGLAEAAAYDDEIVTLSDRGQPVRVEGGRVSDNFFPMLGMRPSLGRNFLPGEDRHNANPVALVSDRLWRQRYAADPNIVGRAITIDGSAFTIVGVVPPDFRFQSRDVDVWRSRIVDTRTFVPASVERGAAYLTCIAKMGPGVTMEQLRAKARVLLAQYHAENPGNSDVAAPLAAIHADPLQSALFAPIQSTVLVLWGAVACLLAIACANVASLVLARASARHRDIRVRLALGAGRARIAQQLITESVLLALLGAAAALPWSTWAAGALVAALERNSPTVPDAPLDAGVMLFTFVIAAGVGIAFGLTPLWMLGRKSLHAVDRGLSASKWSSRFRDGIVAAQIAVCAMLLAGAGLLAQSFQRMLTMPRGMQTEHVAMVPLDLMPGRYEAFEQRATFYDRVLQGVETIPGVRAAGITSRVSLVNPGLGYKIEVPGSAAVNARAWGRSVSPDYFRVVGIQLLRGRAFDEHDTVNSPRVMLINEAFAKKFFPGADPIGRHVMYSPDRIDCEVVGIVADVRAGLQRAAADEEIYLPLPQRPWLVARLVVRTGRMEGISAAIRERVRQVDPEQAVAESQTLEDVVSERVGRPRTTMVVVAMFAAAALLLASVGIYGMIAYAVAQRRREIGIRMALGADGARVRSLLFRRTFRLLAAGLAIGLPVSAMLGRLYAGLLFGVTPGDPVTVAGAVAVLLAVAAAATYFPSSRAAKIDPAIVLRGE
jgi:predicted permease